MNKANINTQILTYTQIYTQTNILKSTNIRMHIYPNALIHIKTH